jgi:hypothetical protein
VKSAQCITLSAGATIVYETRKPHVFRFVSTTRQLLIYLPGGRFASWGGGMLFVAAAQALSRCSVRRCARLSCSSCQSHRMCCGGIRRASQDTAWRHAALPSSWRVELCVVDVVLGDHPGNTKLTPDAITKAVQVSIRHMSRMPAACGATLLSSPQPLLTLNALHRRHAGDAESRATGQVRAHRQRDPAARRSAHWWP